MKPCIVSWSGGKDSCYAIMKAVSQGYKPIALLNVLNEEGKISRSHGIPESILRAQANAAGIPIHLIASSWSSYQDNFIEALSYLKNTTGASHAVFGDIDLDAHKEWEEKVCALAGLTAVLPLWKNDRKELVYEMLAAGIKTIIVSCNETMGPKFLGKTLTHSLVQELEAIGVDPCGEGGEFHTLVVNAPLFSHPLCVEVTNSLQHEHFWFADLKLLKEA